MKEIISYLDDLKAKTGSDRKTAELLKIDRASISTIRNRGQMGDDTAIKIADLLGVKREEVLIAAAIARSSGEVKQAWVNFSRICGYSASFIFSAGILYPSLFNGVVERLDSLKCILC